MINTHCKEFKFYAMNAARKNIMYDSHEDYLVHYESLLFDEHTAF